MFMTKKKTVFVLGAGASFEFGLPVGDTLKEWISNDLNYRYDDQGRVAGGDGLIFDALRHASQVNQDASTSAYMKAARSIAAGLPLAHSIDNYLHNHNRDKHVKLAGKLGIVRSILNAERASSLYVKEGRPIDFSTCSNTWAVRFARIMTEQCNLEGLKERLASMAFIVFNYDRCLEHFLTHAISTSYGISLEKASTFIGELEIYHPYGTVGDLPWMTPRKAEVIEFGGSPDVLKLYRLAEEIKTFTEGTSIHDSEILAIRACMQNADRFVFLGYAYHQMNMDLLLGDTPKSEKTRRVFGTAFGMSTYDSELVRDRLDATLFAPMAWIKNDATCFSLFHDFSMSLSFT